MINFYFHETKRERKYYEGKKQKALTYINHTIKFWDIYVKGYLDDSNQAYEGDQAEMKRKFTDKLEALRNLVNDI